MFKFLRGEPVESTSRADLMLFMSQEFSGMRDGMSKISEELGHIRTDLATVKGEVTRFESRMEKVEESVAALEIDSVKSKSAWSGPRTILIGVGLLAPVLAGVAYLLNLNGGV